MRKRWIGLVLLFVTTAGVLVGWNWHSFDWQSDGLATSLLQQFATTPDEATTATPMAVLSIDPERVMADLATLGVQRYTDVDRDRARQYITEELQKAGWTPQQQAYETGINIYAERQGSNPNAGTIVLGAHYDTVERAPGADDNATGVVTLLEAARLLSQIETPRTLQLVFFDEEELGLLGSQAFVAGRVNPDVVRGAIILDMVGYACYTDGCQSYPSVLPVKPPTTRGDFLAVIGDRGHPSLIEGFSQVSRSDLPQVLTLSIPLLGSLTADLVRSDHAPFWDERIGAVLVTDTANFRNPNYHQSTDTVATIDQPFFTGAVQLIINATARLLTASS